MNKFNNTNHELKTNCPDFSDAAAPITNRNIFDTMLTQEIERSRNTISYLSLLMVEIDDFKNFNDTYGSQAGSTYLHQVAEAFKNTFKRSGDLAVKWGDSKFICLLTDTDFAGAEEMAKKVSKKINSLGIPNNESSLADAVTVSIGGVTSILTEDISGDELLEKLNQALTHAKEMGRNQIVIWEN